MLDGFFEDEGLAGAGLFEGAGLLAAAAAGLAAGAGFLGEVVLAAGLAAGLGSVLAGSATLSADKRLTLFTYCNPYVARAITVNIVSTLIRMYGS